jgi:hypothetical protein
MNVSVNCWIFVVGVYRLYHEHQRLSVFALLGESMPWDVSVLKVQPKAEQDSSVPALILYYPLALYQDRPMALPILSRRSDLAGHIHRPGGRATVMDRR